MECQVCDASNTKFVSNYRPYLDYGVDVFDCASCRSRFAPHDVNVHEKLHSQSSKYLYQADIEKQIVDLLDNGDVVNAKSFLAKKPANSFIIDTVNALPSACKLLEIGCSRGYLAAWFLANDRNVLGVDISPTAVAAAIKSFGDHFCLPDDPRIKVGAPYDVIYHVGTIGCVSSPVEMTKELISLLKPGGVLVFNAPNRKCCEFLGRIWLNTPPPDLVNLFHPEFWQKEFSSLAEVEVNVLTAGRLTSGYIRMLAYFGSSPVTRLFDVDNYRSLSFGRKVKRYFLTLYYALVNPPVPHEYGIHVVLRKNS
ncbi:class I SAM-dependent methyltransferase [Nitrospina gracilis]|nr:class I SAM-dependent methyltransferase [Nitrospina gracilis]